MHVSGHDKDTFCLKHLPKKHIDGDTLAISVFTSALTLGLRSTSAGTVNPFDMGHSVLVAVDPVLNACVRS